jgi:hypothetical protein
MLYICIANSAIFAMALTPTLSHRERELSSLHLTPTPTLPLGKGERAKSLPPS